MKTRSILLILLAAFEISTMACTTFVLKTGQDLVFGRNLDWVSSNGLIVVNKRGVQKKAFTFYPDQPMTWTSKYGSVTFNQFGKEFPFGGMNEKGLVVEIMLAQAKYPAPDTRPAVNESQWIQYQLDNYSTIEEVIASDKLVRISKVAQNLHFLVCDADGNVAAMEFKNGKMAVYKGDQLPYAVLENDPYSVSLKKYQKNTDCRFTKAVNMIHDYKAQSTVPAVDYSFSILNKVRLSGSWSIVYDIKNRRISFKTDINRDIQVIDMLKFDYACGSGEKAYNLLYPGKGNITDSFKEFNHPMNTEVMKDAFETNGMRLPQEILDRFYEYHKSCTCRE